MTDRFGEDQERWLADDQDQGQLDNFEREILNDPGEAEAAYAALELNEALEEAARFSRPMRAPQRWAWAGGLMAALLAFVILLPQFKSPGDGLPLHLRGSGDVGAAEGLTPEGQWDHFPLSFNWRPNTATEGSRYRWELYDGQARRRGIAVVADTVLVRKSHQTPADSLGTWLWLIVELKPDGHEGPTSEAVKFTVKAKAPE